MSWAAAVDVALAFLGAPLAPMRPLLLAVGPTPRRGPLTHDLLVPGRFAGVNVFPTDDRALRALLDPPPGPTRWAGGLAFGEGTLRTKLYSLEPTLFGIDRIDGAWARRRTYHPPAEVDLRGWPVAWPPPVPGESHRLVTVLGDEKRTLNILFQTSGTLADLAALTDVRRFDVLAARVATEGYTLRPAAWERDLHADGRVEEDVLLTLGEC